MGGCYLLDANIFISAHRQQYPFDIVPGFWSQLLAKGGKNIVIIADVDKELVKGGDQLTQWYQDNKDRFQLMIEPCQQVRSAYSQIIARVYKDTNFSPTAKDEFASKADSWLCAYGLAFQYPIVTNETFRAEIKKRVPIPNVCQAFNIKYMNIVQFMRTFGFIL